MRPKRRKTNILNLILTILLCVCVLLLGAELGMSERAAEGRLYRIRKQLKKELGGEIDE